MSRQIQERILEYVRSNKAPVTTDQVAKALDIAWQTAQLNLLGLAHAERIKFQKIGRQNIFMKRGMRMQDDADYKTLFEQAPQASWIFDRETLEILAVNNAALQLYGRTREELLRMHITDLLADEEQKDLLKMRVLRKAGFSPVPDLAPYASLGIWRVRKGDGTTMYAEVMTRPIDFKDHIANIALAQPVGAHPPVLDPDQGRFPLAAILPTIILTAKIDGTIDFANQYWYEYTGLSHKETNMVDWGALLHPEDVGVWREKWAKSVEAGEWFEGDFRIMRADGEYRWHAARMMPILNDKGDIALWACSMSDVHEHHLIQEVLRESEEQFHTMTEAMPQIVWTAEPDGKIDYFNARWEEFTGIKRTGGHGEGWAPVVHLEDSQATIDVWTEAVGTGTVYEIEHRIRNKDGEYRWMLSRGVPIKDDDGLVIKWFGTTTDIHVFKQTERELEFQKYALDRSSIVAIADADGTITYVNDKFCEISGYSREELIGENHRILNSHLHSKEFFQDMYRTIVKGDVWRGEIRNRRKNGSFYWVDTTIVPSIGQNGLPERYIAIHNDITERKQAEEESEALSLRLQEHLENTPLAVLELTPDLTILRWSGDAERIFGFTAEEMIGKTLSEARLIHDYDATHVIRSIEGVTTGNTVRFVNRNRNYHKDGSVIECQWYNSALHDEHGRLQSLLSFGLDVTAEKKRRDDMEAEEKRMRFIATISELLDQPLDATERLRKFADAIVPTMADRVTVDLLDKGTFKRVAVKHLDPIKVAYAYELHERYPFNPDAPRGIAKVLRTGEPEFVPHVTDDVIDSAIQDTEHAQVMRESGLRSVIIIPLISRGKTLGVMSFSMAESGRNYNEEDLSFLKDLCRRVALSFDNAVLYEEIQSALMLRDDFLSIASHELKTPVTSIKAFLQSLERRMENPERFDFKKNQEYMRLSVKQVDRLALIINDLLDINRMNQGRLEYHFRVLPIGPIIADVVERMSVSFPTHRINLKLQDLTSKVKLDELRFEQVLTNLITNAVKYSSEGSVIDIAMHATGQDISIDIQDRGIGIAPEQQEMIFDRYYRAPQAATTRIGGLGVGLFISSELVKAHGGVLGVKSESGAGSVFTITLPVAEAS